MSLVIAVDIGGTHLRAAAYAQGSLRPIRHKRAETLASNGAVFDRLAAVVEAVWPDGNRVAAIGVASPGPLDPQSGMILATPNIPEWRDFPLGRRLSERFGVPVHVENDANMAALGEWRYGAGRGHHDVLYLTVSTGIGGGVICNDRLLHGHHGLAAELGHVTVLPDGPLCSCGFRGHLEALAAGPAIVRYVNEQLAAGAASRLEPQPELSARQVANAARKGDALARAAYARAGEYLGLAVASFVHIFDPSIIIFGGGVSKSGPLLFEPFQDSLQRHVFNPRYLADLTITAAALGDDAGLLGARTLVEMKVEGAQVRGRQI